MVTLGGNLGIWQGIGWAKSSGTPSDDAVLAGALSGLGGLLAGAALAPHVTISPGQAEVLHSSLAWGGWFGLVGAQLASPHDGRPVLESMLGGSAAGLAAAAAWCASGHDLSPSRMRLVNLGGILGAAAGFGMDLLIEADSGRLFIAIPAATSLAGAVLVARGTRDHDARTEALGARWIHPTISFDGRGRPLLAVVRHTF